MDALKSAGRALIRSPSLAKQSWGGGGRHRKLPENWTDTRETLLEGMVFSLKYLGMTLVERPKGEELSAAAVKRIVATAKASGKKLQKVTVKVSPRGIVLTDNLTNQLIENVSIYRISYCTADRMHDKVFAYIAQSRHSESLECHAFLCAKRKMAQAVTLTVAQAFKVAFEFWQVSKEEKEKREKANQERGDVLGTRCDSTPSLKSLVATGNLLDLEEIPKAPLSTVSANTSNVGEAPRPQTVSSSTVVWVSVHAVSGPLELPLDPVRLSQVFGPATGCFMVPALARDCSSGRTDPTQQRPGWELNNSPSEPSTASSAGLAPAQLSAHNAGPLGLSVHSSARRTLAKAPLFWHSTLCPAPSLLSV